jgi:DNA-directed RNA polymerase subunit L
MFRNYSHDPKDPSNCHTFEIHNIDLAIVNGIRRIILTDVHIPGVIGETIGTDEPTVNIIENTGALHNEIITHRIGLIPICLSENEIEFYDNSIRLELNIKNEGNKTENVTTKDITIYRNNEKLSDKESIKIFPANKISKDHILITRLRTGEHLHFTADVVKRCGRDNASFNPVSLCNFSYIQDPVEADKQLSILDKERAYFKNKYGDPIAFKFDIEHINPNIAAKYLVNKALEIMIAKLNTLRENMIDNSEHVEIRQFQDIENTYEFYVNNEDDTLGNLIQSYIHNKYIRESNKFNETISCLYVGYVCPHPLKALMVLRITLDDETNKATFVSFLEYNCKLIIDELNKIKLEWNKFIIDNGVI